eukprot:scaffold248255_cov27-Tisochrysis_lutea.AAC.2
MALRLSPPMTVFSTSKSRKKEATSRGVATMFPHVQPRMPPRCFQISVKPRRRCPVSHSVLSCRENHRRGRPRHPIPDCPAIVAPELQIGSSLMKRTAAYLPRNEGGNTKGCTSSWSQRPWADGLCASKTSPAMM